jgi:tRNA (guanine37-N1)-methyltransferase
LPNIVLYLALVHYPTYNRYGEIVATCITPLDLHDLGRIGLTYGVKSLYLTNPFESQKSLIGEVIYHWAEGVGGGHRPHRKQAVGIAKLVDSLGDAFEDITEREGIAPFVAATTAKWEGTIIPAERLFDTAGRRPALIVFGTGYGLTEDVLTAADAVLEPIRGPGDFYHLPVRSAVAIYIDRILKHTTTSYGHCSRFS